MLSVRSQFQPIAPTATSGVAAKTKAPIVYSLFKVVDI